MNERATNLSIDDLLRHGAFVRALARRLVADDATADDVVQEVWLRALQRPPARGGSITGWLARVARNFARDRASSESARADREQSAAPGSPEGRRDAEQRSEIVEEIASAFAGLPAHYREPLYLRFYEEKAPPEIAAQLGCPVATVKTRLSRGIELLKQEMEQRARARGVSLRSLIAGLVAAPEHAAAPISISLAGGVLAMKNLVAALVMLAVLAGGWWAWRAQQVGAERETPAALPSDVARLEGDSPGSNAVVDARDVVQAMPSSNPRTLAEAAIRLRVVDESRTALAAVKVELVTDREVSLLGATNVDGVLEIQPLPKSAERVTFSLASYAVSAIQPPRPEEGEVEVVLRRGGTISGRVIEFAFLPAPPEKAIPVAGARVLTFGPLVETFGGNSTIIRRQSAGTGSSDFARVQIGDPSIRCAVTDANGFFQLDGLPAGEACILHAGAPGRIQSKRTPTTVPTAVVPSEGVVLELEHAYGVAFEIIDEQTGETLTQKDWGGGRIGATCRDRSAQTVFAGGIDGFLAGLSPKLYEERRYLISMLASAEQLPEAGPIYLDAKLAGYEVAKVEAMARPLTEPVPIMTVTLERTAAGFGTLALELVAPAGMPTDLGEQRVPQARVQLIDASSEPLTFMAPLRPGVQHALGRVPGGRYQATFQANESTFVYPAKDLPPLTIDVKADEKTVITVPLEGSGSIELQVENSDGSAFDKTLQLQLIRDKSRGMGFIDFRAPPYRILALDPGTYSVQLHIAQLYKRPELQPAPVAVTAGVESTVRVRLP